MSKSEKIKAAHLEWKRNTGKRKKRAWRLYRSLLADLRGCVCDFTPEQERKFAAQDALYEETMKTP